MPRHVDRLPSACRARSALKKGTIVEWACPYKLDGSEISPLLDALSKNGSLEFLNVGPSGIRFSGDNPNGTSLVEKMNHRVSTLSSLQHMVIRESGFRMPVGKLRESPEVMAALSDLTRNDPCKTSPRCVLTTSPWRSPKSLHECREPSAGSHRRATCVPPLTGSSPPPPLTGGHRGHARSAAVLPVGGPAAAGALLHGRPTEEGGPAACRGATAEKGTPSRAAVHAV